MKFALFGARAINTGLGTQSSEFFNALNPDATVVIDLSHLDKKRYYPDRFKGKNVTTIKGIPTDKQVDEWLKQNKDLDCIFCMETPYNYHLFKQAKKLGIKTILQYNYEFLDYLNNATLEFPTVLLAPTLWNIEKVYDKYHGKCLVDFLPVPVNTDRIQRRQVKKIKTFVHIAGYDLYEDRNGTRSLLEAIPLVKSDCKFIIYAQKNMPTINDPRVKVLATDLDNYEDLYKQGDCLLYPRRYGGLSLPRNEAMAAGMVVAMPRISPNWGQFDPQTLLPVKDVTYIAMRGGTVMCAQFDPVELARKIDGLAGLPGVKVVEIVSNNFKSVPTWDECAGLYVEYMEGLEMDKPLPVKPIQLKSEVVAGVDMVLVRVLRTFCDGGKVYGARQVLMYPEERARRKQAQRFVEIIEE